MQMRFSLLLAVFAVLSTIAIEPPATAAPWIDLVRFERVEADVNKDYALSEQDGPWMIMATTFRGPNAMNDARQLVLELRKNVRMPAYTHSKQFDYSESFNGRGVDPYGNPRKMRHHNNEKVMEVAVLVGNYPSVDDAQAQKDLKKIKQARPQTLTVSEGQETSQSFAKLREMHRTLLAASNSKRELGPMRLAFITTNPLLPDGYFRPRGIDKFTESLNKGMKHSLLDCPGNYTVKVASFNGYVAFNPETIKAAMENKETTSRLEEGARKAYRLAVALRAKGYEAYQFHDRNSSIVTVGGFNSPPVTRPDGAIVYEPQVQDLIRRFGAKHKSPNPLVGGPSVAAGIQPASLLGIPFDVHPTLIEVPKRALSADYARRPESLR